MNDSEATPIEEKPEVEAPAVELVTYENQDRTAAIAVPKRIASQAVLEAIAEECDDQEFALLCEVLRDRRWTDQEFKDRVEVLRPGHPYFTE